MAKIAKIDYNTGQIVINMPHIFNTLTQEVLNEMNIWQELKHKKVKIKTKEYFNKAKTQLNRGELLIKSSLTPSYLKIVIKDRGNGIKIDFEEFYISEYEKRYFISHTLECVDVLTDLILQYYKKKVAGVRLKGMEKLQKELEEFRKILEKE